jgi:hypothetical protein
MMIIRVTLPSVPAVLFLILGSRKSYYGRFRMKRHDHRRLLIPDDLSFTEMCFPIILFVLSAAVVVSLFEIRSRAVRFRFYCCKSLFAAARG